jgi:hypothetical protein
MGRMSTIAENPAIKTLRWKNRKMEAVKDEKGKTVKNKDGTPKMKLIRETGWYYYDKVDETDKMLPLPLSFTWLESATSFTGYNQSKELGVYSNEVLDIKKDKMTVRCGDETIASGLYNNIKDVVKGQGGKYCIAVYAYCIDTEEIVRFLMTGSSGAAWMNFHKHALSKSKAISCTGSTEKEMKTGASYEEPTFVYIDATDDVNRIADIKYEEVANYFEYINAKNKELETSAKLSESKAVYPGSEPEITELDENDTPDF